MNSLSRIALLGLIVTVPLAAQTTATQAAPAPPPLVALEYDSLAFARQMTMWFYSSEVDSLWAHTDSTLRQNMGGKDQWGEMIGQFIERVGMEDALVEERWVKRGGRRQYWRVLRATEFTQEPVMLRWVLMPGKMIGGVGMNPASRAPEVDPS